MEENKEEKIIDSLGNVVKENTSKNKKEDEMKGMSIHGLDDTEKNRFMI